MSFTVTLLFLLTFPKTSKEDLRPQFSMCDWWEPSPLPAWGLEIVWLVKYVFPSHPSFQNSQTEYATTIREASTRLLILFWVSEPPEARRAVLQGLTPLRRTRASVRAQSRPRRGDADLGHWGGVEGWDLSSRKDSGWRPSLLGWRPRLLAAIIGKI